MSNLKTAKLSPEEAMGLEHKLSIEEIGQALKQMKNGKSPGTLWSSSRFFGKKLKFFVLKAYN